MSTMTVALLGESFEDSPSNQPSATVDTGQDNLQVSDRRGISIGLSIGVRPISQRHTKTILLSHTMGGGIIRNCPSQ